jgi:hypothetical protein
MFKSPEQHAAKREKERLRVKAWRAKNPAKMRQYSTQNKEWNKANPEKTKAAARRHRDKILARKEGESALEYRRRTFHLARRSSRYLAISATDLAWPTHCPVLGVLLDYDGRDPDCGWSVDQRQPSMGYIPGNVQIISMLANRIKTNATAEQVRKVAEWMTQLEMS